MAATSAPTMLPDVVALWRHAIEALPEGRLPCRYLTLARWTEMRAACLDFCDRYGAEAHRLGWTDPELFGVHPEHGTLRLEACGALMTGPQKATGVEPTRALFGILSGYRDTPGKAWGPPIWEFAAGKRA